jgi:hypothetical protein
MKENPTTPEHWREEPWKRCEDEMRRMKSRSFVAGGCYFTVGCVEVERRTGTGTHDELRRIVNERR